jgi:hypothetical protein
MSTRMSSDPIIARDRGDALRKLLVSRIAGHVESLVGHLSGNRVNQELGSDSHVGSRTL